MQLPYFSHRKSMASIKSRYNRLLKPTVMKNGGSIATPLVLTSDPFCKV